MSYVTRRSWKNRSSGFRYTDKKSHLPSKIIVFVLLLFLLFELITSIFIISYRIESISMEPTIPSSAVILASPLIYGPEIPFSSVRLPGIKNPVRGDIVVCSPAFSRQHPWYIKASDTIIAFFTFQKKKISGESNWVNSKTIKRVVGVPGDTVKMENFEIFIKPKGKKYFFSECDIIQVEYSTENYQGPELLPKDFPFSGNMEAIVLGEDQYFLSGDNRSMSNDSYYWGPVGISNICAKVILEYAPEIKLLQ